MGLLLSVLSLLSTLSVSIAAQSDLEAIPHVNNEAKESFLSYRYAANNKAYAIAPGGAWSWRSEALTPEEAEESVLEACQKSTQQKCILYALNDEVVFDSDRWSQLWGPYLSSEESQKRRIGNRVGERLPNLSFSNAHGKQFNIDDFRDRVTFVHFWGSWCPPCMREFPSLQKLSHQLRENFSGKVEMVLLQVREPFAKSQQWAQKNGFGDLPLFDSGYKGEGDQLLSLGDGTTIKDRKLAITFPSSYVVDKNGIILFKHRGPVRDWSEYLPFFQDAAAH